MFRGLDPRHIESAIGSARILRVPPGYYLHGQGDPARSVYLLAQGAAKLTQVSAEGHETIIRFFFPPDVLGLLAVFTGTHHDSSAQAIEPCTLLAWDQDTMIRLMVGASQLSINAIGILGRSLQASQSSITERTLLSVEARTALTLLRLMPRCGMQTESGVLLSVPLSCEDLGEAVGATLFTVNRILNRWRRAGIIERVGRLTLICSERRLREMAGSDPEV